MSTLFERKVVELSHDQAPIGLPPVLPEAGVSSHAPNDLRRWCLHRNCGHHKCRRHTILPADRPVREHLQLHDRLQGPAAARAHSEGHRNCFASK